MFNDTSQGVRNFGVGEEVISTDMISFIVGGIRKEARIRRRFRSSEFLIWEAERIWFQNADKLVDCSNQ